MDPIRIGLAILAALAGRRQGSKAYRAAQSVVRPVEPKSRPIGPDRERIPDWR